MLREHERILAAIAARDADRAGKAASAHFQKAALRLLRRRDLVDT